MKRTIEQERRPGPGRRPSVAAVATFAALALAVFPAVRDRQPASTGTPLKAKLTATCSRPIPTTQVTAHDGKFWSGATAITFHGRKFDTGTKIADPVTDLDQDASWCMNFVRLHVHWTDLEPTAPKHNPDGTWTHTYDATYLAAIKQAVSDAWTRGLSVLIENAGNNQVLIDPNATFFAYPLWLYQAPYNSAGVTYTQDDAGSNQAQADFYTDALRKQFFNDFWKYLAIQLKSTPGIVGYEVQNEPQVGTLATGLPTTQMVVDWQLSVAKLIRATDPSRVIVFTTWAGYGPGLPDVDLHDWVTAPPVDPNGLPQALGYADVAFMAHDYFGARWGSGLNQSTGSSAYHEFYQPDYNNVLNGDVGTAPPYIGSTLSQVRWIQDKQNSLSQWKIPLIVGEFGIPSADIGAYRFYGTVTTALQLTGANWSMSGGTLGIVNSDGSLRPYAQLVIDAAHNYP